MTPRDDLSGGPPVEGAPTAVPWARRVVPAVAALSIALAAAWLCVWLRTPIPWMLGPLFATAACRVSGLDVRAPPLAREAGQWIIGTALGLYFTPVVLAQVREAWWLLLAGAAFALAVGYLSGALMARIGRIDATTALFASVPGGAPEMARLAERFGARVDRVAAAQSLRILVVVGVVPALFALAGARGSDVHVPGTTTFDVAGFALLMAATLAGALVAARLGVPNAFVLGSLAVSTALTAGEVGLSSLPAPVSNGAQLLLGCALGSRFEPDFLRGAPRFLGAAFASIVASIVLCALFGLALAAVSERPTATLLLGLAPGGVAEMAITAKVLQLGVPLVTAFQVTRLVVLLLLTGPVFRRAQRWRRGRP